MKQVIVKAQGKRPVNAFAYKSLTHASIPWHVDVKGIFIWITNLIGPKPTRPFTDKNQAQIIDKACAR